MRNLLARLRGLVENADIILVFLTALVLGVLDLMNLVPDDKASGAILPVLAALAFVWIMDRSRQGRVAKQVSSVADDTQDLKTLLTNASSVRVLSGPMISRELREARLDTDRWLFKGGTGTFTRAVTLPECFAHAERNRRSIEFRLEILDPMDAALCANYTKLHQDLAPAKSEERDVWTPKGTRMDAYSTILACCWYRQLNEQLLDIDVRLSSVITLFRWDLSSSRLIITQRGPRFPAISFPRHSPHYNLWSTELRNSLRQARRVPLELAPRLSDSPTPAETFALFAALRIPLPDDFGEVDAEEIARNALNHQDPYRGHIPPEAAWAPAVPGLA
ncbi:hypothetical protein Pth03_24380 [Planotetraspora thailandica]|uniref:Uncharacterized protein n=1 Tax=Planotetraspora thailandica TaxID=487172 RepID=A0A8J3XV96_9ACTN|nr:hypothetical protein [Planotetraspora thailandica]GII54049.1 hypothetical protein Pth03_24380 [Planotetraspora thailandica]